MTVDTLPRPGLQASPPASHPERSRFSLESIRDSRSSRAVLGVILLAAVLAIVYLIILLFTGKFSDVVKVRSQLPAGSNAVPVGAPVQYRNITVGKVVSEGQTASGNVSVTFDIYRSNLAKIPTGVKAQVEPLSIFGNQYVNLVAPGSIGPVHITAGAYIPPYGGAPSTSLQGTVTQLYSLLNAIKPADLDTALTALATALNGEGQQLGQALSGSDTYISQAVAPHLQTLQSDLALTKPVSNELNMSAANIVGLLKNSTVTANTLNSEAQTVIALLNQGDLAVKNFAGVAASVQNTLPPLLNESGPLLADITQNPDELAQTLSGLTQFSQAVGNAESDGPYLTVTANLPVVNISAGVNAALGYDNPTSLEQALGSAVNPPTYTSGNCPEYVGVTNPYCGTGGSPDATPVSSTYIPLSATGESTARSAQAAEAQQSTASTSRGAGSSNPSSSAAADADTPFAQEMQAVQEIAAALNSGRAPSSPGLADLILYPLLSSLSGQS